MTIVLEHTQIKSILNFYLQRLVNQNDVTLLRSFNISMYVLCIGIPIQKQLYTIELMVLHLSAL